MDAHARLTDKRTAKRVPERREDRFQFRLEDVPILAYSISLDGKIIDCNGLVLKTLGYRSKKELVGKPLLSTVYTPSSRKKAGQLFLKWKKTGRVTNEELQVITKHGEVRDVLLNVNTVYDRKGKPLHSISTHLDITNQKQIENELHYSEERYRALFENSIDAILLTSPDGRILAANPEACRIFHRTEEEICRLGRSGLVDATDPRLRPALQERIKTGRSRAELGFRRKDGTIFVGEVSSGVFKNKDGLELTSMMIRDITERMRTETEIKNLARYSLDNPNPVFRVSQDGIILHANPASEMLLKSWGCKVGGKAPKYWRDVIAEVIAERSGKNIDVQVGEKIYLFTLQPVKDASYVNIYGRDISERKRMEEAVARLAAIVQWSEDAIIGKTLDGVITSWNKSAERIYGYSAEEAVGESISILIPSDRADDLTHALQRIRNGERVERYETERVRKDGKLISVSLTVSPINDLSGRLVGASTIARDITEGKRMEEKLRQYSDHLEDLVEKQVHELRKAEEKYHSLIENIPDAVFTIDLEGHITFSNKVGEKITGYPLRQLLSMNMKEIIAPQHFAKIQERLQARKRGEEDLPPHQFEIARSDGKRLPVEMSTTPLVLDGHLYGIQGIVRDVTERKEMEKLRQRATVTLLEDAIGRRELENMKAQFISVITHELRTPLVSIKGYMDLAISEGPEKMSKEVESELQVVRSNTDRLLSLVNDLLDVQRMQAGRLQLNLQPTDFKKVIDSCITEIQPMLTARRLSLKVEVPEAELLIQGDKTRLCQVMMNLLSNATKFSLEGSEVTLDVEEQGETVKVSLSDSGIGISKEDLLRIFEPFTAIQKPSYIKGTGLGLNITKGLVEAHGGKIWAESDGEGKGATFIFTLPKQEIRTTSIPIESTRSLP